MLRYILNRIITRFERRWSYDAGYMRELVALSPWAFIKFSLVTSLGRGPEAPPAALAAAGLVGTLTEDCGGPAPRSLLDLALAHGLAPATVQAILVGDAAAMGAGRGPGYARRWALCAWLARSGGV